MAALSKLPEIAVSPSAEIANARTGPPWPSSCAWACHDEAIVNAATHAMTRREFMPPNPEIFLQNTLEREGFKLKPPRCAGNGLIRGGDDVAADLLPFRAFSGLWDVIVSFWGPPAEIFFFLVPYCHSEEQP